MKMIIAATMNASIALGIGVISYYGYQEQQAEKKESVIQALLETFEEDDRHCLTQNVFFEARNQSEIGQEAVARVTLNRMESNRYPDTICGVVWQNKQFSWTHDGLSDEASDNILEQRAWKKAEEVTNQVLRDYVTMQLDITYGATHYHADYVSPYWVDSFDKTTQIESHVFYR